MVNIQVPLSSQKSNQLLKDSFKSPALLAHNDLEFLKDLSENLRLIIVTGSITTAGNIIAVIPDTGTTFFFLGGSVQNTDAGGLEGDFTIENDGTERERVKLQQNEFYEWKLPMDRLVGNMSKVFRFRGLDGAVSATATLYGWNENTVKIS